MLREINEWKDYTRREKEVQEWLELVAQEERKRGHKTKVGYLKLSVDEEWYEWKERKGELEWKNFRN